jgi:hypothetical protein
LLLLFFSFWSWYFSFFWYCAGTNESPTEHAGAHELNARFFFTHGTTCKALLALKKTAIYLCNKKKTREVAI